MHNTNKTIKYLSLNHNFCHCSPIQTNKLKICLIKRKISLHKQCLYHSFYTTILTVDKPTKHLNQPTNRPTNKPTKQLRVTNKVNPKKSGNLTQTTAHADYTSTQILYHTTASQYNFTTTKPIASPIIYRAESVRQKRLAQSHKLTSN